MAAPSNYASCVSVIMPAWNAASTIEESISSVRDQDHGDWELLIVDDGSSDATATIVAAAAADARIRLLTHDEPRGPAAARNTAIAAAQGRHIAFLDADDLWLPKKLSCQLAAMETSGAAIVAGGYRRMSSDGSRVGRVIMPPERITLARAKWSNPIGTLTGMIDRAHVGDVLMPSYYYDDYVLWVKLLRAGHTAIGVQVDAARYRIGRRTVSSGKVRRIPDAWQSLRSSHDTSIGTIPAFAWYALRGLRDARRYRPRYQHTESG